MAAGISFRRVVGLSPPLPLLGTAPEKNYWDLKLASLWWKEIEMSAKSTDPELGESPNAAVELTETPVREKVFHK